MRPIDKNKTTLLAVFVVGLMLGGVILASPYIGGWEIQLSGDKMELDGTSFDIAGLKTATYETDRDFIYGDYSDDRDNLFSKPGITVEHGIVFHVAEISGVWVEQNEPNIIDTYDIDYTDEHFARYNQYAMAYDVTIKTTASKYYKPQYDIWTGTGYLDWGWFYEDKGVVTDVFSTFTINPWIATGQDGNWTVMTGWAGIMSAQLGAIEFGLVDDVVAADGGGGLEDLGHTAENFNSVGSSLNMYISGNPEEDFDFDAPEGLINVPSTVQIETTGTLGAGAQLGLCPLNHVWDLAVRNVYVKYRVIVHVLTSVEYEFILGDLGGMEKPVEGNTAYMPKIAILELMAGEYGDLFLKIGMFIVIVLVLYVILKALGVVGASRRRFR